MLLGRAGREPFPEPLAVEHVAASVLVDHVEGPVAVIAEMIPGERASRRALGAEREEVAQSAGPGAADRGAEEVLLLRVAAAHERVAERGPAESRVRVIAAVANDRRRELLEPLLASVRARLLERLGEDRIEVDREG